MDVQGNTAALLALIEEDRLRRCHEHTAETEHEIAQILREARARARALVREALVQERRRLRQRLAGCEAALATETRLHQQRRFRALLDAAGQRLPEMLAARWNDAARRAAWVAHVIDCARSALPAGNWAITHAPGWPPAQRQALADHLSKTGIAAAFIEDVTLAAGLEIRAGGNRIDGTAAGLMADPGEIGARLLDALGEGRDMSPGGRPA